jgi:endonuclease/exonuclease/phosphatase family metal-dependent hydrolase
MAVNKRLLLFCAMLAVSFSGCAQRKDGQVIVAFYNCENFFDTVHNPAKEDEEFTPDGKYHYTARIYGQKLHNIATVIQSMDGPAIVGMAEVENNTVLQDLISQPEIFRRGYKYEWYDGPDPRGINVAMIYDPAVFRVLHSEPLHVDLTGVSGKSITRDVLHVCGILVGDTVDVFVNHWPSRRRGGQSSGPKRDIAAGIVRDAVAAVRHKSPGAHIIIMGDLNDNPVDSSIVETLGAKENKGEVRPGDLYDPWINIFKAGGGTEEYRHSWNLFDQIIISGNFLTTQKHKLHYVKAEIYKPDFIVDHYKGHDGEPHRSFVGTHWINGYSDHFPVLLYFDRP